MPLPNLGGGSLSSRSSLVTTSSITNSDPDSDPNPNGFGNGAHRNEQWHHTTLQISVPFFIAGIGTIGAGLVLAEVSVSTPNTFQENMLVPSDSSINRVILKIKIPTPIVNHVLFPVSRALSIVRFILIV